ncbi:hypothetical protein BU16DRAFT_543923 [Lophium mytilinum]|uniref:Uncharacterized protein n=1 Tax=Lophium mytilinum TaxID=390894 RepID=A0A6A6QGM5_9PEZI|nr:hypothetical protein BU16DRAFT_543923 [Lophium mytilinum]
MLARALRLRLRRTQTKATITTVASTTTMIAAVMSAMALEFGADNSVWVGVVVLDGNAASSALELVIFDAILVVVIEVGRAPKLPRSSSGETHQAGIPTVRVQWPWVVLERVGSHGFFGAQLRVRADWGSESLRSKNTKAYGMSHVSSATSLSGYKWIGAAIVEYRGDVGTGRDDSVVASVFENDRVFDPSKEFLYGKDIGNGDYTSVCEIVDLAVSIV